MQFQAIRDPREPAPPEPVVELMVRVVGESAYLCARKPGHTAWTYLLELGYPGGVRLFDSAGGFGLPVLPGGALKMSDVRAQVGGLPT